MGDRREHRDGPRDHERRKCHESHTPRAHRRDKRGQHQRERKAERHEPERSLQIGAGGDQVRAGRAAQRGEEAGPECDRMPRDPPLEREKRNHEDRARHGEPHDTPRPAARMKQREGGSRAQTDQRNRGEPLGEGGIDPGETHAPSELPPPMFRPGFARV